MNFNKKIKNDIRNPSNEKIYIVLEEHNLIYRGSVNK